MPVAIYIRLILIIKKHEAWNNANGFRMSQSAVGGITQQLSINDITLRIGHIQIAIFRINGNIVINTS